MPTVLQRFCDENDTRIEAVVQTFSVYQPQVVNTAKILQWLGQFDPQHYEVALRLMETVAFYDLLRLQGLSRDLHQLILAQLRRDNIPWNDVYFVALGGAGDSGQEVTRRYRDVNRVQKVKLRLVPELQKLVYDASKKRVQLALVFLDDFIGSGKQVSDYWKDVLSQLVSISPRPAMYVGCYVACEQGVAKVRETPLRVINVHYVPDRLFLARSNAFNNDEKRVIRGYCDKVGNKPQDVYLELMLAFAHGAPNNTLSVLRGSKGQRPWRGILPRFDDLS